MRSPSSAICGRSGALVTRRQSLHVGTPAHYSPDQRWTRGVVLVQVMAYTCLLSTRIFQEGEWCDLAEGLVGPVGVVDVLPSAKQLVDLGESGDGGKAVVELVLVRALGGVGG